MIQIENHNWQCAICNQNNRYWQNKCQSCKCFKWKFHDILYQSNQRMLDDFDTIEIFDVQYNTLEEAYEPIEILRCKIQLDENSHKVIGSKQYYIKPRLIPLVYINDITQEQADNGVELLDAFQILNDDRNLVIFETREAALKLKAYFELFKKQFPIRRIVDLTSVFPFPNIFNSFGMMKSLKIDYDPDCFGLADCVDSLLDKGYKFKSMMLQTLENPIPEEESRLTGFDYLIVIDYEATCFQDEDNLPQKKRRAQEIIEFPAVVYDINNLKVVKEFHHYIKPVEVPILSEFCTDLTGISQEQVDNGISIQQACELFEIFSQGLHRCIVLTCGDYDMNVLKKEATRKKFEYSNNLKYYINIKKVFPKELRDPNSNRDPGMVEMLQNCNLALLGKHHSGIDDARNITRICEFLIKRGFVFNERMISYTYKN
ncbi:hypothetical protein pb186bvf_011761 [Paramecium bursaria]